MNMRQLLDERSVLIVCGSGGVGKTTTAAAVAAMAAACTERRVLVLTIDPARRLADALGLERLGNEAVAIDAQRLAIDGVAPKGTLHAAMLDTKQSWDQLIERHAPNDDTRRRIMGSPLYANITGRFVQSHDYIAMERLYEIRESEQYDLIVIDTPPASHASDFLDAPKRMASFFDSKLLKFLVAPQRSMLLSLTARPFLQMADRLLGQRFLADISEFFGLLETMRPGFISRANQVEALLAGDQTTFMAVTTLEPAPRKEAERLAAELARRRLHLGAMVLNRVLPDYLLEPPEEILSDGGEDEGGEGVDEELAAQVETILTENFRNLSLLAAQEKAQRQALTADVPVVRAVPWFGTPLNDMGGLLNLGRQVWTD